MASKFTLPIEVNPASIQITALSAIRTLSVLITGVIAVFGFVSKGDLDGLYAYVQGSSGLAFIAAIVSLGTFAYGLWIFYQTREKLVTAADAAPDDKAIVKPSSAITSSPAIVGAVALLFAAVALWGCATVGNPTTAAQKLYAAIGSYDAALHGANVYAAEPGSSPAVIHKLHETSVAAAPAVTFARAYPACKSGAKIFDGAPCVSLDFTPTGILANVAVLQAAILALQERN